MAQPNTASILDRVFARFAASKNKQVPESIPDPKDPTKQIPNPEFKKQTSAPKDVSELYAGLFDAPSKPAGGDAPKFALTAESISKAADKLDFMANLPEDLKTKLSTPDGLNAENISALVQHAGRAAYAHAMSHTSQLTDTFVDARIKHESRGLPDAMRKHLAKTKSVSTANMDNPVVREHMSLIAERIADKFPEASEDEVAAMTQEYFTTMAKAINPGAFGGSSDSQDSQNSNSSGELDFGAYLKGEKSLEQAKQPAQAQQQTT